MTPEDRETALRSRVHELTPAQRAELARSLGLESSRGLVAFVTSKGGSTESADLDEFLRARLPSYMVPERYLLLDELPRTAAGKVDRARLSEAGATQASGQTNEWVAPRNEVEETLAEIWMGVLGLDEISIHDDFFEVGGDSLLSIRVLSRTARAGIEVSPEAFFAGPTIAQVAALDRPAMAASADGPTVGEAPLLPIQEWFFDRIGGEWKHWNQAVMITVPDGATDEDLEEAVRVLVERHDCLRVRFEITADPLEPEGDSLRRQVFLEPPAEAPFRVVTVPGDDGERAVRMAAEADRAQASLDPESGDVFQAIALDGGGEWRRLLLIAHHLVVDRFSLGIILDDLAQLLSAESVGAAALPPKTTSVKTWTEALKAEITRTDPETALEFWPGVDTPDSWREPPLDFDPPTGPDDMGHADSITASLDSGETAALLARTELDGVTVQGLLLTGLILGWSRWTGAPGLLTDVEGHGRDQLSGALDVSRTVGWFTTVFPIGIRAAGDCESVLERVGRALSDLPLRGGAHGLLRYYHPDEGVRGAVRDRPRARVLFNYLGSVDIAPPGASFRVATEPLGRERARSATRAYPLEINSWISRGRCVLRIEYSTAAFAAASVERFGHRILEGLRDLSSSSSKHPVDPLRVDASQLERVADLLDEIDGVSA